MHGGAWGSGAPLGNSNALKHGYFTGEAIEERKFVRTLLAEAENLLFQLPAQPDANCNRRENRTRLPRPEQIRPRALKQMLGK